MTLYGTIAKFAARIAYAFSQFSVELASLEGAPAPKPVEGDPVPKPDEPPPDVKPQPPGPDSRYQHGLFELGVLGDPATVYFLRTPAVVTFDAPEQRRLFTERGQSFKHDGGLSFAMDGSIFMPRGISISEEISPGRHKVSFMKSDTEGPEREFILSFKKSSVA